MILDFDLDNILIDEKSYQNILVYNISYKSSIDSSPSCITFDKIDGFIRVYDGTRYLVLFGRDKYDSIYDRIRYLISVKSNIYNYLYNYITNIICHNYVTIKVDSYDSLPLEKAMSFHNVIILVKSVCNKDKSNYCYNIFLEKASYELTKKYVFVLITYYKNGKNDRLKQIYIKNCTFYFEKLMEISI